MEKKNKITIVLFSGDMDKALAAFNLATGAASMGMSATIFFTFWGLNVVRKHGAGSAGKGILQKMMSWMNKGGADKLPMSRFNMCGLGPKFMGILMRRYKMPSVPEMLRMAKELNVKLIACTITMGVMGISKEDIIPEVDEFAGVVTFLTEANESGVALFI